MAGRFRVERLLASGGMGRVYRATQESIGRSVALKVILHDDETTAPDARAVERFAREAAILARLQHPNIVTLHDYGEIEGPFRGRSYLAMELLEGQTLADCLDVGVLEPRRVVAIAEQIARGLRYAHQRGVVHRDLKPSNVVLVTDEGGQELVKLVDFGIGKLEDPAAQKLTRTGAVLGTMGYMAPEQLYGAVTTAIDMYALGVLVFEALTGVLPCDESMLGDDFGLTPPRLGMVAPDLVLPEGLESLVMALLARVADDRPTAVEALARLVRCGRSLEVRSMPAPARGKRTAPELRLVTSTAPPARDDADSSASTSSPPPPPEVDLMNVPAPKPEARSRSKTVVAVVVVLMGCVAAMSALASFAFRGRSSEAHGVVQPSSERPILPATEVDVAPAPPVRAPQVAPTVLPTKPESSAAVAAGAFATASPRARLEAPPPRITSPIATSVPPPPAVVPPPPPPPPPPRPTPTVTEFSTAP